MDRIKELVEKINRHSHEYYVLDAPTISDDEWDKLYDELKKLESETGIVLEDSPTRKIGGEVLKGFKKHTHIYRQYSLDKSQSLEELSKWAEGKYPLRADYKFDGLALVLTYDNGRLVTAATRGNGRLGEDVTKQVKTIKSVPMAIAIKDKVEIVGQGMMKLSEFVKQPDMKNPRNAVAGAIRNIDPEVTRVRNIDFFAFGVNFADGRVVEDEYALLEEFLTLKPKKSIASGPDDVKDIVDRITAKRHTLDVELDGIVFTVVDPKMREELGYTIKFPRWAMAYKFGAEVAETKLLDIIWQVGRSGKVTPIAVLEPVELAGATITRATLNNYDDIIRKNVSIGEMVQIRRSNEVIPEILSGTGGIVPQDIVACPSCGAALIKDGVHKFCVNVECPARLIGRFVHFVSRDCMNIEGLSEKTIELLIENRLVKRFSDIYKISKSQLTSLPNHKEKKVNNLVASIEKSKKVNFANFINALGISHIGRKASETLAEHFGNIDELRLATVAQLLSIHEFGDAMAESLVDYDWSQVDELLEYVEISYDKVEGVLSGAKICVSGTFDLTRNQIHAMIKERGGIVMDNVSKSTDALIAGDNCGAKLDKAVKLGVRIIEKNDLAKYLESGNI